MPPNADPTLAQRYTQAGTELYNSVYQSLQTERGVHLETALSGLGYLAGCSILKGSGVNLATLPPGSPVFVDQVNETGPQVIQHLQDLLAQGQPTGPESLKAPVAAAIPPGHIPLRSYNDLFQLLWPNFEAIITRHAIPAGWAPYTCTAAASRLIIDGQSQIPPSIAKAIFIESMVKASKTVPPTPQTTPEIKTRDDFFRILAETTSEIDARAIREPAYPVWGQLRLQLHAMLQWSANRAQPAPEELPRISIGLIAARELEPATDPAIDRLITRLHLLNHYWRNWAPSPAPATFTQPSRIRRMPLMFLLAIPIGLALVATAFLGFKTKSPYGTPVSPSVRTPGYIATLISTLEPYTVTLHRDPANDRYRVALFLYPADGSSSGRLVPLASGFRATELRFDARLLGYDGANLWIFAKGILAFNLKTEKLIQAADLRRLNPSLTSLPGVDNSNDPLISPEARRYQAPPTDLFAADSRKYVFSQRLYITAPDYRHTFEINPETLQAVPAPSASNPPPDDRPEHFLTAGGLLSPNEWIGVHSPAELARSFNPGSSQSTHTTVEQSRELRRIYTGRVEPSPPGSTFKFRIVSLQQLSGKGEYLHAALLCSSHDGPPLVVANPEGFLITYTSQPGLSGTLVLARFDKGGKPAWTADTGIGTLQQILPGSHSVAFVGVRPQAGGKVPEPVLVIVNNQSGTVSTSSLWQ